MSTTAAAVVPPALRASGPARNSSVISGSDLASWNDATGPIRRREPPTANVEPSSEITPGPSAPPTATVRSGETTSRNAAGVRVNRSPPPAGLATTLERTKDPVQLFDAVRRSTRSSTPTSTRLPVGVASGTGGRDRRISDVVVNEWCSSPVRSTEPSVPLDTTVRPSSPIANSSTGATCTRLLFMYSSVSSTTPREPSSYPTTIALPARVATTGVAPWIDDRFVRCEPSGRAR